MEKPHVEAKTAPAPEDVVIADLIEGDGPEAQPDGYVEVHYVGVDYETGQEFDSSWDRGGPVGFWLIVPPEAAYGPEGGGHPLAGRTLVFIIDLIGVG